ncbi:MAG: GNAT family N-acetyltransferase [Desulfurococcaceae archaeon]
MVIRKTWRRDLSAITEIYNSAKEELGKEDSYWFNAVLKSRSRRIVFLVAEVNDKVVGFILAYRNKDRAYIENIAVHENYRNMGIGRILIAEAEKHLFKHGAKSIYLSVKNWNMKALNFYIRQGYGIRGIVFLMKAKPSEIIVDNVSDAYMVTDVNASKIKTRISKPLANWSNLVDEVDKFIYRKLYRDERALVVKKNRGIKALVTYSVNDDLVVDSIMLSSYSAIEALETALTALKNLAVFYNASGIEIPVDASKKKLVMFLEKIGFKVNEVEYLLQKELS